MERIGTELGRQHRDGNGRRNGCKSVQSGLRRFMRPDGWTDINNVTATFRDYANAHKRVSKRRCARMSMQTTRLNAERDQWSLDEGLHILRTTHISQCCPYSNNCPSATRIRSRSDGSSTNGVRPASTKCHLNSTWQPWTPGTLIRPSSVQYVLCHLVLNGIPSVSGQFSSPVQLYRQELL